MRYVNMMSWVVAFGLLCAFSFPLESPATPLTDCSSTEIVPWGGAYLEFAGKFGGKVTREQIADQRELQVKGCAKGSRIFTFTLKITHAGRTTSYAADSNCLTDDMLDKLRALQAGDTFTFKKIKAYLPNEKDVVDVHSREFEVV